MIASPVSLLLPNFVKEYPIAVELLSDIIFTTVAGCIYYYTIATLNYYFFFVKYRKQYLRHLPMEKLEIAREIKTCFWNIFGEACCIAPLKALSSRYSWAYSNVSDYGWLYLFASIPIAFVWADYWVYWIHRVLHESPFLYKHLHSVHHSFVVTSSYSGFAFHFLDSFLQALPTFSACWFFPLHKNITLASTIAISIWSVSIHDHVPMWKSNIFLNGNHHTIHHDGGRLKNYGQFLSLFDKIFGTYESSHDIYFGYDALAPKNAVPYEFKTESQYLPEHLRRFKKKGKENMKSVKLE